MAPVSAVQAWPRKRAHRKKRGCKPRLPKDTLPHPGKRVVQHGPGRRALQAWPR